ncbi:MAG: tRNA pseudouridine(55) synthase TruB [Pseudomonadota bacterium]
MLDKPVGLGSTQAVGAIKRLLREAGEPKTKVGHGGTLDPLASGVLPIALGEATKLAGRMLDATKGYDFTIRFGEETDTLDGEGEVVATSEVRPTREQVEAVLPRFTGAIEQIPPAYSALKVGGKAAYARARAGEEVALRPRAVTIHSLSIRHPELVSGSISPPAQQSPEWMLKQVQHDGLTEITLSATVSKGTYIRSLARDIAHALGTVGHVSYLRRTRAGPFTLDQAVSLDFLTETAKARALTRTVLPLDAALDDIPALPVTPAQAQLLRHGQQLVGFPAPGSHQSSTLMGSRSGLCMACLEGTPVALVEASADGLRVVRGFNLLEE